MPSGSGFLLTRGCCAAENSNKLLTHNTATKPANAPAGPPARSIPSAKAVRAAQLGFRLHRGGCLWRSLGWLWGLFSPVYWWYASAWLLQGIALALIALWPGTAVGRAYFGMCVSLIFTAAQLWAEPLSLPRDTGALLPYRDMPPGHVQRLKVVAALCNALFAAVQCGLLLQGGFSYLYETALGGAVFSGSGVSNPYLEDIVVHLPSVEAAAASALNFGFFAPLWPLLAVIVLPVPTARCLLRLGTVAHRPCLSRLMAASAAAPAAAAAPSARGNPMFRKTASAWDSSSKAPLRVPATTAATGAASHAAAATAARRLSAAEEAQRLRFDRSHSRAGAAGRASIRQGQLQGVGSAAPGAALAAVARTPAALAALSLGGLRDSPTAARNVRRQSKHAAGTGAVRSGTGAAAAPRPRPGAGGPPAAATSARRGGKRKGAGAKGKRGGFL